MAPQCQTPAPGSTCLEPSSPSAPPRSCHRPSTRLPALTRGPSLPPRQATGTIPARGTGGGDGHRQGQQKMPLLFPEFHPITRGRPRKYLWMRGCHIFGLEQPQMLTSAGFVVVALFVFGHIKLGHSPGFPGASGHRWVWAGHEGHVIPLWFSRSAAERFRRRGTCPKPPAWELDDCRAHVPRTPATLGRDGLVALRTPGRPDPRHPLCGEPPFSTRARSFQTRHWPQGGGLSGRLAAGNCTLSGGFLGRPAELLKHDV